MEARRRPPTSESTQACKNEMRRSSGRCRLDDDRLTPYTPFEVEVGHRRDGILLR